MPEVNHGNLRVVQVFDGQPASSYRQPGKCEKRGVEWGETPRPLATATAVKLNQMNSARS